MLSSQESSKKREMLIKKKGETWKGAIDHLVQDASSRQIRYQE